VLKGDPARKIVQYAQNQRADVILMATHGVGPFRRFILGSSTAKVLHDADCPVWTGAHLEETPHPVPGVPRHILCAVDLGPRSGRALACAAALQEHFGCRLTVMHVSPELSSLVKGAEGSWNVTVRSAAEKEVRRLCEAVRPAPDILIETGEPAQEIAAAVHRLPAELLVIGRGSASGVFGRLRTNAYAIIRQSPCPVLSI
jgi:nucleotide-binding universal stress UspA family protein